ADVGRLLALRAVDDVELDRLALREGLVPLALDRGEVDEHVVLPLARDEPEALLVAEPLHGALLCQRALLCLERAERSTARARRSTRGTGPRTHVVGGSPVGFERAAVVVLEAEGVVLGRVAVGDLEYPAACRPGVGDPMRRLGAHHELLPRGRIALTVRSEERRVGKEG